MARVRMTALAAAMAALTAMGAGAVERTPAPATPPPDPFNPKSWAADVQLRVGANDNIQLRPQNTFFTGDQNSVFAAVIAGADHSRSLGERLTARAGIAGAYTSYTSDEASEAAADVNDYNLLVLAPTVGLDLQGGLFGRPANYSAILGYRYENGQIEAIGLSRTQLRLQAEIEASAATAVTAGYTVSYNDAYVSFPDEDLDDRDGAHHRFDVGVERVFSGGRRRAGLSVAYEDNDADGTNFAYDGVEVALTGLSHLFGPVYVDGRVIYGERDYDGFTSTFVPAPGRTEQDHLTSALTLLLAIDQTLAADVTVEHVDVDSNADQFQGEQTVFSFGLTRSF